MLARRKQFRQFNETGKYTDFVNIPYNYIQQYVCSA
jgi:hypothetical protein